jgi:hypothetical protein
MAMYRVIVSESTGRLLARYRLSDGSETRYRLLELVVQDSRLQQRLQPVIAAWGFRMRMADSDDQPTVYVVVGVGTDLNSGQDDIYLIGLPRGQTDTDLLRCWTLAEFERLPKVSDGK